jgi:hypothetical protein
MYRHNVLALVLLTMGLEGCLGTFAFGRRAPIGFLYGDASSGLQGTNNNIGKKKGEACASSILGLITTGDAGIRAAADAGGVTQVSAVDASVMNILGIYTKYCTIVSGDSGEGTDGAVQ